jgi:DNA repair protein RadC
MEIKPKLQKNYPYKLIKDMTFEPIEKITIKSSKDAADYARNFYSDDIAIYESVFIILLNRANATTGWAKISQGGITGTVMDVQIICKYAVQSLAKAVVICHNHPSGSLKPSTQDIKATENVKNALKLFEIPLLDHIILTEGSYASFQDEGLL